MTYLLLLVSIPLCLFAPLTILFAFDEIWLLCDINDELRSFLLNPIAGMIAFVTYFASAYLGAEFNKLGLIVLIQLGVFIVSLIVLWFTDKADYKRNVKPNLQIKI